MWNSCCPAAYLEIVRVLPHVDTKDWNVWRSDRILVLGGRDMQLAIGCVADQPAPSAALNRKQGRAELVHEVLL